MSRILFNAFEGGFSEHQVTRPVSDVVVGTWAPSSGSELAAMLNEETPDDASWIQSAPAVVDDTCEVALTAMMVPHAGPVLVRVRATLVH